LIGEKGENKMAKLEKAKDEVQRQSMASKAVEYDCALLSGKSLDKVNEILEQTQIIEKLKEKGVGVPEMIQQANMHCTFRFMAGKKNEEKREYQLSNNELNKESTLRVTSVGAYVKDGVLRNLGLRVDEKESLRESLFSSLKDKIFSNDISHITIAINTEKDENNKKMGKAVETPKCFEQLDGTLSEGESSFSITLPEPIDLDVTMAAIKQNIIASSLTDYPEKRLEREKLELVSEGMEDIQLDIEEEKKANNDCEEIEEKSVKIMEEETSL
jgi:2'-5' RNA ligase